MRLRSGAAAAVLVVVLLSLGGSFWLGPRMAAAAVAGAARLRAMGPLGWLMFTGVETLVTLVGIVPGALLGIVAGAVYGVAAGFCAGALGITAGAVAAFGLSRSALRPWIGRMLGSRARLAMLDRAIAEDGWRIVALLRISPVMPFSITSYALGFSGVLFRDYVVGTLASLPSLLGYVGIGALGGLGFSARTQGGEKIHFLLLGLGAAATLGLTVHVSRMVGRVLRAA